MDTEEDIALVEDEGFRRIHVFGFVAPGFECPAREGDDFSSVIRDREYHTAEESVAKGGDEDATVEEYLFRESFFLQARKHLPWIAAITDSPSCNSFFRDASLFEVIAGFEPFGVLEILLVP